MIVDNTIFDNFASPGSDARAYLSLVSFSTLLQDCYNVASASCLSTMYRPLWDVSVTGFFFAYLAGLRGVVFGFLPLDDVPAVMGRILSPVSFSLILQD